MAIDGESFELLLSSVQRFARDRLMPAEDAVEEHDEVSADIVEDMTVGLPVEHAAIWQKDIDSQNHELRRQSRPISAWLPVIPSLSASAPGYRPICITALCA